jgi:benzil reductase ((S)-benzoin forming)
MKVAIVTGGSRGLGAAVVEQLKSLNWQVWELSRTGSGKNHISVDLCDPSKTVEALISQWEKLQSCEEILLISNAGTLSPIRKVGEMNSADIAASVAVNITSSLMIIQQFVSYFRNFPGKKSIVSISSGAATKGYPGWSLYCAGKAAQENYMRALSMEEALEPNPFRVISFNPGVMDTEMQREIREAKPSQFPMIERFLNLKRDGALRSPDEVARRLLEVLFEEYSRDQFIYTV